MPSTSDPLWAITTYYNPANYKTRRDNFRVFRKYLNVPLMTIELAKPGEHQLTKDDGDVVLSLVGEDRIWQTERLVNIGLAHLPRHVEYVAWIDCDVVFEDDDWASKAKQRLSRNDGLLQLFGASVHLPRSVDLPGLSPGACARLVPIMRGVSIASALAASEFDANEVRSGLAWAELDRFEQYRQVYGHNCHGIGWAARRETISASGIYDRNILGGTDTFQVFAALTRLDEFWALRPQTPAHQKDALDWTKIAKMSGLFSKIDSLDHRVYHLWHGSRAGRDYLRRHDILLRHDFDPKRDIAYSSNGTWQWSDAQGPLAREVGDYFFSRREDG